MTIHGVGWTTNVSSRGLMIASPCTPAAGAMIEVKVPWPWELDGAVQLQLVATGIVVRAEETGFAVELRSHEFRTMGRKHDAELSDPQSFVGLAAD